MTTKILGADELHGALTKILQNLKDKSPLTKRLDRGMRKYAHVQTGYMKSTIYDNNEEAGADADYAGYEADRGGEHDYAQQAIDTFDWNDYLNEVLEPY